MIRAWHGWTGATVAALMTAAVVAYATEKTPDDDPVVATTESGPVPAASGEVKVITYNLCGAAAHCDNPGEVDDRTGYVIDEVLAYDADIVSLTEVCYLQYAAVRDALAAEGYDHMWVASRSTVDTCTPPGEDRDELAGENALRFGNVLLAKNTLSNREEITLTPTNYGTAAVSKALCADADVAGLGANTTRACVAHPRSGQTGPAARARWSELTTWAAEVDRYLDADGQVVILSGDFNAEPGDPEMDPFYGLDGIGEFIEVDMANTDEFTPDCEGGKTDECRSGEPTFVHPDDGPKKIDYIFFSAMHAADYRAEVRPIGPNSDHHLLRGQANVTTEAAR